MIFSTLFWTNQIHPPRIEKITFPNANKSTVVKDRIQEISAITVDQELGILIWFDPIKNAIEYSSLDGHSRRDLHLENNIHPISMTAYQRYLFWIEKDRVEKMPIDLNYGRNIQTIFVKDQNLTDIIGVFQIIKKSSHLYCNVSNTII